jgi:hypothetical protein
MGANNPLCKPVQRYGSIIGMFELNNLGIDVPTPVEVSLGRQLWRAHGRQACPLGLGGVSSQGRLGCMPHTLRAMPSCARHEATVSRAIHPALAGLLPGRG